MFTETGTSLCKLGTKNLDRVLTVGLEGEHGGGSRRGNSRLQRSRLFKAARISPCLLNGYVECLANCSFYANSRPPFWCPKLVLWEFSRKKQQQQQKRKIENMAVHHLIRVVRAC